MNPIPIASAAVTGVNGLVSFVKTVANAVKATDKKELKRQLGSVSKQ